MTKVTKKKKKPLLVIGWMERITLPDLAITALKTKIDTGARTSALHATGIEIFRKAKQEWVRFDLHRSGGRLVPLECPLHDIRHIKNTGGVPEERVVIRTRLLIADRVWPISVSLTDRSNMRFPMIVGRSALKNNNIAVHTRRTYLITTNS